MATKTVDKRTVKRLSFWEKLYIPEIAKGLSLTLKQMFQPSFTRQYPEETYIPAASYRGRPVLVQEEYGERCVACGLCSRVCPAIAIEVQAGETTMEKERYPSLFEINMLRCIFCGYCQEVCPEEAIFLMQDYSLTGSSRDELIYNKEKLLALGGVDVAAGLDDAQAVEPEGVGDDLGEGALAAVLDLHPRLVETMSEWFAAHPGGQNAITQDGGPLTVDQATDHFKRTLRGHSKWSKVPGFHTFRHSLASILASNGTDQRYVDAILGHTTEDMRKRYQHLFPRGARDAIRNLS